MFILHLYLHIGSDASYLLSGEFGSVVSICRVGICIAVHFTTFSDFLLAPCGAMS
jgi:hypothetical protein